MKYLRSTILLPALIGLISLPIAVSAQSVSDSLSLSQVILKVMGNYPSIKKAEIEIESSDAKIGLVKAAYNPTLDLSASYSHLGPTSTFTLPEYGTFNLMPSNNYAASLDLNQQLYDFGKTRKSVDFEQQSKALSQMSLEQLKQRLSSSVLGNYYTIVYLQEAIKIKDEELKNLNDHLGFVQKKLATGSATPYEVLTTQVRISNIENQKTDLTTSLQVQLSQLNSFLGQSQTSGINLKKEISAKELVPESSALIATAIQQRDEMKVARQQAVINESRLKVENAQNSPILSAFASAGFKNGYTPEINDFKANYLVGVGFKLPILDGKRTKYNRVQVANQMQETDQDTELARRNIADEVVQCRANVDASLKKIVQSELQYKQASQAYRLAETSYKAGTITNLDLLDSSTSLSESSLSVTKSYIDYTVSLLKLKIALGERIY